MTRSIGLVGRDIGYSLSPRLHAAALAASGLNWEYSLLDTEPFHLHEVVDKLRHSQWAGVNVTVPYKQTIMALMDQIESSAAAVGAVNTIVNCRGCLTGYNTDKVGLEMDMVRLGIALDDRDIAILGAGGGASAALALAVNSRVTIFSRRRIQGLELAHRLNVSARVQPWTRSLTEYDLLINCTPPGSGWQDIAPMAKAIYDLNYHETNPPRGNYHNGLGMLVFQAAESFRLWTGYNPVGAMAEAVGLKF